MYFASNLESRYKLMTYNTFILPNGLRIIHTPSPTRVAYCGYAIEQEPAMNFRKREEWLTSWSISSLKGRKNGGHGTFSTVWRMWEET